MKQFKLKFLDGPGSGKKAGSMRRRIALQIMNGDGTYHDADVQGINLESVKTVPQIVKRWSAAFDLDESELTQAFRQAAVQAAADCQRREKPKEEPRGAKSEGVSPITLDDARPVFRKWLKYTDPDLLDVVFGVVIAHRIDGDPVWLFIIGAPGDGKTEALRALFECPDIYALSTLTPGSLISGYIVDEGEDDPSLLPKLDGKILVVKDFTAVLQMPNEARQEILGILRDAYDGEAGKAFGTGDVRKYKSRFGFLAAVTPVIESYWGVAAQLGERFLRFRIISEGRKEKVRRALANSSAESTMREELMMAAHGVLAQKFTAIPAIAASIERRLIALADFVALARSEVARDRQGVMQYAPAPEVGTRVGKELQKFAQGIAMARGKPSVDDDIYRIVCRVGHDCIPSLRGLLLNELWKNRAKFEPTSVIADGADLPTDTANAWLGDLRLLGIVERQGEGKGKAYEWRMTPEFQATISDSCVDMVWGGDSAPQGSDWGDEPWSEPTETIPEYDPELD